MYLLIDNYDSFTYNLYQCFAREGVDLVVKRNDKISIKEIEALDPEKIIISPGPKQPKDAGISNDVIKRFGSEKPILGICLGHQCIAKCFGGKILRVQKIVHGKASPIHHTSRGIFKDMPNPFAGARYHSLRADAVSPQLEITARTEDDLIMGLRHKKWPLVGLQFHPESFLTEDGQTLIKNFIAM